MSRSMFIYIYICYIHRVQTFMQQIQLYGHNNIGNVTPAHTQTHTCMNPGSFKCAPVSNDALISNGSAAPTQKMAPSSYLSTLADVFCSSSPIFHDAMLFLLNFMWLSHAILSCSSGFYLDVVGPVAGCHLTWSLHAAAY